MKDWRFGRGWTEAELAGMLKELTQRSRSVDRLGLTEESPGWTQDGMSVLLGKEPPGPPPANGLFEQATLLLADYKFSDTSMVNAYYDKAAPLQGRNMLLELRILGFRFLSAVRVQDVRRDVENGRDVYGFRYDTLEGHIETGYEWFLVVKDRESGDVTFELRATWRIGVFPTWWAKLGFLVLGAWTRRRWQRQAGRLMQAGLRT